MKFATGQHQMRKTRNNQFKLKQRNMTFHEEKQVNESAAKELQQVKWQGKRLNLKLQCKKGRGGEDNKKLEVKKY